MPELPEVETVRRVLQKTLPGHRIQSVKMDRPNMLRGQSKAIFSRALVQQKILRVDRRAKYLLIRLQTGSLLVHLGMSGQVFFVAKNKLMSALPDKHTHLHLGLDRGAIFYGRDPRMFGRYQFLSPDAESQFFLKLGPEPLDKKLSAEMFYQRVKDRRASLKAILLNQQIIAGLGNIYADESLFQARLSPFLKGTEMTRRNARILFATIQIILKQAICARGTSISDYLDPRHKKGTFQRQLHVYGREGSRCFVCHTPIQKTVLAQRGTHWCPRCQKAPQ